MEEKKKKRIRKVLSKEYISSEDEILDQDGPAQYAVRPLVWRSERVNKLFAQLDEAYKGKQTERSRKQTNKRFLGEPSERPAPDDAHPFALENPPLPTAEN